MKKNKENIFCYVIACIVQTMYYFFRRNKVFVFANGIPGVKMGEGFPILDICALIMPGLMMFLIFSNFYSFHMEEYGRLLLVRDCNIRKRIYKLFKNIAIEELILILLHIAVNMVFDMNYFIRNLYQIIKGGAIYYLVMLVLLTVEFFVSTWFDDSIVMTNLGLYLFVSVITVIISDNKVLGILFFPGRILRLYKINAADGLIGFFVPSIVTALLFIVVLLELIIKRCSNKDYF